VSRPKLLLSGAAGQIGFELARLLPAHSDVYALDRAELDLADRDAIVGAVRRLRPDIIVNAAAYTAVDRAETDVDRAYAINAHAPAVLAEEAKRLGAVMIHYSTDYVFDGSSATPYAEDSSANPLNVYGRSKLEGERAIAAVGGAHLILRTSWVYGLRGQNFLLTMRRLARERDEIRIVSDQRGVPNWSREIARITASLVGLGSSKLAAHGGLYHLSARGSATWFDFARAIFGDVARPALVPITSAQYPTPARRPAYGVLAPDKFESTFGFVLPDWRSVLRACLEEGPSGVVG
jgi:dTDP-4-dehydrorhamnose reductase